MAIATEFPLSKLNELTRLESYNKHYYRPTNYIHKWWARRLGSVFRTIVLATFLDEGQDVWERYYQGANLGGKIVLDPFMGGGTTVIEALRLGCKVVGVDLNPVAWWTVREAITPANLDALDDAFYGIERRVAAKIRQFYKTACPHCGRESDAVHILWVKRASCVACSKETCLHPSYTLFHQKREATIFCPTCGHVFPTSTPQQANECPHCGHSFVPTRGAVRGASFTCADCGRRQTILEATKASDRILTDEMFALRYLCPTHGQAFKAPDADDIALYEEAAREFEERREELLFPHQSIPCGLKTDDLLNHNYRYWHELFNPRQLLCLDTLLGAILEIKRRNIRELMLTLFSSCLEFNNMFCSYKGGNPRRPGAVRHIFSHHAFVLPRQSLENNLWGVEGSSGSFSALYASRLRRGKEYAHAPIERTVHDGKVVGKVRVAGERIEGHLAADFEELSKSDRNALLLCSNSEHLDLPDYSVDAIITDPPYFDNVQYSELADFFYVWLRLGLHGKYAAFRPELTPKADEVVKNVRRGKGSDSFLEGLTGVFCECNRVLKDDGMLVFTFHHKDREAWSIVLKSVLDADFYVSATYPVHAEMPMSVHIQNQKAMEYDAIIFCRKRVSETSIGWDELERQIRHKAGEILRQLTATNGAVSKPDTSVIVLGKCLEFYSKYYPNVTKDGRTVSVEEAINSMQSIVETLTGTHFRETDQQSVFQLRLL